MSAGREPRVAPHRVLVLGIAVVVLAACPEKATTSPDTAAASPPPPVGECDSVDETDLSATANCYWRAKKGVGLYRFLSAAKKTETSEADFISKWTPLNVLEVRVAKQESMGGSIFAAVSVTDRSQPGDAGPGCTDTASRTWTKEHGRWRRAGGTKKVEELTEKKFAAGDYSGAAESAEEWLKLDPLSIDAYKELGFSVLRGAKGKSTNDVVRALLGIDDRDSIATFAALSLTDDPDVAESYLARFRPDDCQLDSAVFNVAAGYNRDHRYREVLTLLEENGSAVRDPTLVLPRINALVGLRRAREVPTALDPEISSRLAAELERRDPAFAASWCGWIADAMLKARQPMRAREWVEMGLRKDPTDPRLADLLRAIKLK